MEGIKRITFRWSKDPEDCHEEKVKLPKKILPHCGGGGSERKGKIDYTEYGCCVCGRRGWAHTHEEWIQGPCPYCGAREYDGNLVEYLPIKNNMSQLKVSVGVFEIMSSLNNYSTEKTRNNKE